MSKRHIIVEIVTLGETQCSAQSCYGYRFDEDGAYCMMFRQDLEIDAVKRNARRCKQCFKSEIEAQSGDRLGDRTPIFSIRGRAVKIHNQGGKVR